MPKIDYREFKAKLRDIDTPDEEIARYLTVDAEGSAPFDPLVIPDPDKVEMDAEAAFEVESALDWANCVSRWRRQQTFRRRIAEGEGRHRPVLVSEGDSWFQFPFLIKDVIDQLGAEHLIWSLDAAGDTADNMVNRRAEYMDGLREQKANNVKGFLFSAAGNDVIGQDALGNPVLASLVKPFQAGKDAAWHIDMAHLSEVLRFLETAYRKVVATIRAEPGFERLPIFVHGYDYAIPGGFPGDPRHPSWAKQDQWLGRPLRDKGIEDLALQRGIIRVLLDSLYDMLFKVAGTSAQTRVFVVDVRNTLKLETWADEIHGTDEGFRLVGKKFAKVIADAI
jgi:hypothetical protein